MTSPESLPAALAPAAAPPRARGPRAMLRAVVGADGFQRMRELRRTASRAELRLPYPLGFKLRAWSRGFTVENAVIYDLDRVDAAEYVTDYARLYRCHKLNPVRALLDHKLLLRRVLADGGYGQPETVGLVTQFGMIRDPLGDRPRHVALDAIEAELAADGGAFILKPQAGGYGRGIVRAEVRDGRLVTRHGTTVRPFHPRDARPGTLIERALVQHEFWERLSPSSVNTLRILTLWTPGDDAPFVARAVQRIGTLETLPTDNWDTGGILATVDAATGRLGVGRIHPFRSRREVRPYREHPDTGAPIEGVELPLWQSILDATLSLARRLPMTRYIGWDVAVDADGRVSFIEGNANTGVRALQVERGLLADPRVARFYRTCGVI